MQLLIVQLSDIIFEWVASIEERIEALLAQSLP